MTDRREKANPEDVQLEILWILKTKERQSSDIRDALKNNGMIYSRVMVHRILSGLIDKDIIGKKLIREKQYPVYVMLNNQSFLDELERKYDNRIKKIRMLRQ